MPVDDQLFVVIPRLRAWAITQAPIKRLWIYGSRLRGTQRHDSNLDIAIELYSRPTDEVRGEYFNEALPAWRKDLCLIMPFAPNIQMYAAVWASVNSSSMLVFERGNGE
jgi:hypothetical protein